MTLTSILEQRKITKYQLAKKSNIPYSTLNDICNGKTQLEKCSAETIYKLSKVLDISMESLLEPCFVKRINFDLYMSNVCHRLKQLGDIDFIIDTLQKDDITKYYERNWYFECFYLLAMLDYISNQNKVPLCDRYDNFRKCSLQIPVYPSGVRISLLVTENNSILEEAMMNAIPEFKRFNIAENEVRDVI